MSTQAPLDLITRAEAAAIAGTSEMTIRRAVYSGELPQYRRTGHRQRYVSRADVQKLFAARLDHPHTGK